ncbi:MAG: DUF4860 domain-containing protein [Lawsonibacter sp.]|nr:DUF4860 domain-containing protein [Lawsonibacter sp.]
MNHTSPNKHHMDSLLALVLFGVFAACILSVLLTGSEAYRRLTIRDQAAYDRRTCVQYIATKVRQAPGPDSISLSSFGDGDALMLTENIEDELYVTRIYCDNGWIRELFSSAGEDFVPDDGEKVLQAQALSLTLEGDLLSVRITSKDGSLIQFILSVRGKEGAVS